MFTVRAMYAQKLAYFIEFIWNQMPDLQFTWFMNFTFHSVLSHLRSQFCLWLILGFPHLNSHSWFITENCARYCWKVTISPIKLDIAPKVISPRIFCFNICYFLSKKKGCIQESVWGKERKILNAYLLFPGC